MGCSHAPNDEIVRLMAYGKTSPKTSFLRRLILRWAKIFVSAFPLNAVRVMALKSCGFKVGQQVYVGNGLTLIISNARSNSNLIIGDRVAIAPRVNLVLASDANWSKLNELFPPIEGTIELGDDCWIGANVTILPNVKIGEMSIVGAGSVVTKDVAPYTVVAGVPAKLIKSIER